MQARALSSRVRPSLIALIAIAAGLSAGAAHAQPVFTPLAPKVLERIELDRWIHDGQHPAFVAFDSMRHAIHVRGSITTGSPPPTRSLTLQLRGLHARLLLDPSNRIRSANVEQPAINYNQYQDARDRAESRRRSLQLSEGGLLGLPYARVWDVPFRIPSGPLAHGMTWTDTLALSAENEGLLERLDGVWHGEVIGDTVIDGRALPLVRTRADVRYRSRNLTTDAAFDVLLEIEHDAAGTLTGTAAIDTAYGVRAAGTDSTVLSGTAWLRTGDGRSYATPVRYERQRTWLLQDSAVWAQRADSLRAAERAQSTGMLRLPRTPEEQRIQAGDAATIEAALARWRNTSHPNERVSIERLMLMYGGAQRAAIDERMRAYRLEAGDTATVIRTSLESLGSRAVYSPDLLPYLDDIGRLWRLGIVPRFTYIELANQLLRATPILQPDSTQWPCQPAHCAAAIAQLDAATEPRLRDAALVGAFARDPARWYARLAARADSGSLAARNALRLAHGVGATVPAQPHSPMPGPDADWRAWRDWLGASASWSSARGDALRVYTARTGRDPLLELEQRLRAADTDSARAVFAAILRGMNRLAEPSAAELARVLTTGSSPEQRAASEQLSGLLRRHGTPAPDSLRTALIRPLLDSISRGTRPGAPWPVSPALQMEPGRVFTLSAGFHGVRDVPIFVLDQNLTPAIRAALPAGYTLITRDAWNARPQREGGVLITIAPSVQWEDFVSVGWSWTVLERRAENEAPSGYAGGTTLHLLRTADGWRIVYNVSWIT